MKITIDTDNGTVQCGDAKISIGLLEAFDRSGIALNKPFIITERSPDNVIHLRDCGPSMDLGEAIKRIKRICDDDDHLMGSKDERIKDVLVRVLGEIKP